MRHRRHPVWLVVLVSVLLGGATADASTRDGGISLVSPARVAATASVPVAIRASRPYARVSLFVNGRRRWSGADTPRDIRHVKARGLRAGANRLVVRAWTRAGRVAQAARVVRVSRGSRAPRRGSRDRFRPPPRERRTPPPAPSPAPPSTPAPSPAPPSTPAPTLPSPSPQPAPPSPPAQPTPPTPTPPTPPTPPVADPPPTEPSPSPPAAAQPDWQAGFEGPRLSEWTWYERDDDGVMYAADAASEGIPAHSGAAVARFEVTQAHRNSGLIHSKLYQCWAIAGPETNWRDDLGRPLRRLPGESPAGTYSAWFFLPADYQAHNDWANIFQFKEAYLDAGGSWHQDPQWWLNVTPANSWSSPPSGTSGRDPVLVANHWGNKWQGTPKLLAVPRGRWFEIRATLVPGERIDWHVDGSLWQSSPASQYPVGVSKARPTGWVFGVGHYGGLGRLWVDDAAFTAAR